MRRTGCGSNRVCHDGGLAVDVHLTSPCCKAVAYDPLNGVSRELSITRSIEATLLKGVLVRDWPLVVRLADR